MKYLIGIQPTGKIHIGNYLGCIKKGLTLQEDPNNDVTFMIANYHALTTNEKAGLPELERIFNELTRLGCKKIVSQRPEYTELFFKLCCTMNLSSLLKMPQYKDKKNSVKYDLGLLLYPVLMAADIIINDPDVVIIGKDQVPHMDLANDIAKKYNGKHYEYEFGDVEKIMSLSDPLQKMSKSLGEKHVLYLFDEDYEKKLAKATSSPEGIQNLKTIAKALGIKEEFELNQELKSAIVFGMQNTFK